MIRLWDYFMRRKVRLLLLFLAFVLGGCAGYKLLHHSKNEQHEPEYISITNWNDHVEIPRTGIESSFIAIMPPKDVVAIIKPELATAEDVIDNLSEAQEPESENNDENLHEDLTPEDLDILEEPPLLDPAVMEILPPNEEHDENNKNEISRSDNIITKSPKDDHERSWLESANIIIMTGIVATFSGYLIYWHFRR